MELDKKDLSAKILSNLEMATNIRKEYLTDSNLKEKKDALKAYQVERLKFTHKECLNDPNTKEATKFFLTEIYSDKDLTKRDADLAKIVPMMCKLFPKELLIVLSDAIELDALTEVLDMKMCKNLNVNFTDEEYMKVYREKTKYDDRKKQIQLTNALGLSLIDVVKYPLIGGLLGKMGFPAKMMGLSEMHELLNNGFNIFKNTKNVEQFLETLIQNEYDILEDIYEIKSV